jgi:hypothetical protein
VEGPGRADMDAEGVQEGSTSTSILSTSKTLARRELLPTEMLSSSIDITSGLLPFFSVPLLPLTLSVPALLTWSRTDSLTGAPTAIPSLVAADGVAFAAASARLVVPGGWVADLADLLFAVCGGALLAGTCEDLGFLGDDLSRKSATSPEET